MSDIGVRDDLADGSITITYGSFNLPSQNLQILEASTRPVESRDGRTYIALVHRLKVAFYLNASGADGQTFETWKQATSPPFVPCSCARPTSSF